MIVAIEIIVVIIIKTSIFYNYTVKNIPTANKSLIRDRYSFKVWHIWFKLGVLLENNKCPIMILNYKFENYKDSDSDI